MYQALYRKYRPKTFDDVCGQEAISVTLKNEVASGTASHAYLFTGLRGSGKTTCSKIIAKAVNCLHPRDGNPCCECEICTGIDNDSITDVMEIDAASNNGVDFIRELREQAVFRPVRCRMRVYIIDEVHMLSTEAFNALLKIMEEPPEHVLFILATTEVHKVPATIISRCQRFDFKRIPAEAIASRLEYIAQNERFSLDHDAGLLIARLADGGMRDAISLLEQCRAHTDAISARVVADCAGLMGTQILFDFSNAIAARDCGEAFSVLERALADGADCQRLCGQLIGHFRNLMVARCSTRPQELIVCLPEELDQYVSSAQTFLPNTLLQILEQLQDTNFRMGRTPNKQTELEMAFVSLCSARPDADLSGLLQRLEQLEAAVQEWKSAPQAAPAAVPSEPPAPKPAPKKNVPNPEEIRRNLSPFPQWPEILERLSAKNPALAAALKNSGAYVSGDLLLIDPQGGMFAKLLRESDLARKNVHECIIEVTGTKFRIGPYNRELYAPRQEKEGDPLDTVLKNAEKLGVDVKVTGEESMKA